LSFTKKVNLKCLEEIKEKADKRHGQSSKKENKIIYYIVYKIRLFWKEVREGGGGGKYWRGKSSQ